MKLRWVIDHQGVRHLQYSDGSMINGKLAFWTVPEVRFDGDREMYDRKQMTLGEFIEALDRLPNKQKPILFEWFNLVPGHWISWRGVYAQLSLTRQSRNDGREVLVEELLRESQHCVGRSFEGYKGGTFLMSRSTPIWADNYGEYAGFAITEVWEDEFQVYIRTKKLEGAL